MSNQMGGIIKRWKLGTQARIAEQELKNRLLHNSRLFFCEFSDQELKEWFLKAKKVLTDQNTFLKRSHTKVKRVNPPLGIQIPENHIRYSFLSNNLLTSQDTLSTAVANTVSALTHGSRFSWLSPLRLPIRCHPLNLSIFAQLAQGLPLETYLNLDDTIHPDDGVRYARVDTRELDNLMIFLSYGTWRPNRNTFENNCVISDSSTQTN